MHSVIYWQCNCGSSQIFHLASIIWFELIAVFAQLWGKEVRGGEKKLSLSNLHGNLSDTNMHRPDESSLFLFGEWGHSGNKIPVDRRDNWNRVRGRRRDRRRTQVRRNKQTMTVNGSYLNKHPEYDTLTATLTHTQIRNWDNLSMSWWLRLRKFYRHDWLTF